MMSKYTEEELRAKAICVMRHLTKGDDVGMELVMQVAMHAGMHPQDVINRIKYMAEQPLPNV